MEPSKLFQILNFYNNQEDLPKNKQDLDYLVRFSTGGLRN